MGRLYLLSLTLKEQCIVNLYKEVICLGPKHIKLDNELHGVYSC